jgi:Dyp-type peroxidase family
VGAGAVSAARSAPELHDVQGLVTRGYRKLAAARFLVLAIDAAAEARAWSGALGATLTRGDVDPQERAVNVAFTSPGLRTLGVAPDVLDLFSLEFGGGMTASHRRRMLGDVGLDAPEQWAWGGPSRPADAVLLLYARDAQALAALEAEQKRALPNGIRVLQTLETSDLQGYEPFGFRDGISQPFVEGLSKTGPPAQTVRFGEFVLGYPNEHGHYTEDALLERAPELGRNGTYLVLRQLRQDVRGFWRFLDGVTRRPDGSRDPPRRARLAAKLVGRWPGGAPLVLSPEVDDPMIAAENDFGYFALDPQGVRCPLGAHIRRANPRDSLDPSPGTDKSFAVNRRHRILRRGREYGPPLPVEEALREDAASATDDERGLHFICLNGNIARQFELVHFTWLNNPKFADLYDDADSLVGPSYPYGGTFTVQTETLRERVTGVPRFVSVRGGAYFFMPGIAATRHLASL